MISIELGYNAKTGGVPSKLTFSKSQKLAVAAAQASLDEEGILVLGRGKYSLRLRKLRLRCVWESLRDSPDSEVMTTAPDFSAKSCPSVYFFNFKVPENDKG
jgi:hypothetical protein